MASSERKRQANQLNSRVHSTGPRTEAGRARSSQNALRHGLASERVLALTRSEVSAVQEFIEDVRASFNPATPYEELLVDRLVSLHWRLRRITRVETELLTIEAYGNHVPSIQLGVAFAQASGNTDSFSKLAKYEAGLDRAFHRTLHELQRAQAERAGVPVVPPIAVDLTLETP